MEDMKQILSNKIHKSQLKPGDHIYSWRTAWLYAHHGIYVGDDKVIHFTRGGGQEIGTGTVLDRIILSSSPSNSGDPCLKCGDLSNADGVIASCLNCFLSGGDLYLFKYSVSPAIFLAKARGGTCTLAVSDSPEDAIHRAEFLLENGFGVYNIFKNNCEDFAIYCKTGLLVFTTISVGRSGQAASFLAATSAVFSSPLRFLTTSFPGLAVVGCGVYCLSRFVADIGIRRDVNKISVERLVGCTREALAEAVMEPQTCISKVEEAQALVPSNTQVPVEQVKVAQALVPNNNQDPVEQVKVAQALVPNNTQVPVEQVKVAQALVPNNNQDPVEKVKVAQALVPNNTQVPVEQVKVAQALVPNNKQSGSS